MRHRKANIKLGRTASHRRAMLRNMATSLFEYGHITTTVYKAKALKPIADRLVTLAKRGDLHSLRQAASVLFKKSVLSELFKTAKETFSDRICGYTSVVRVGLRAGDASPMVKMELIGPSYVPSVRPGAPQRSGRSQRVAASQRSASGRPSGRPAASETAAEAAPAAAAGLPPETGSEAAAETAAAAQSSGAPAGENPGADSGSDPQSGSPAE